MSSCYVGECVCFVQLGFNEAGVNKSSSILIYQVTEQIIYTLNGGLMPIVIKKGEEASMF